MFYARFVLLGAFSEGSNSSALSTGWSLGILEDVPSIVSWHIRVISPISSFVVESRGGPLLFDVFEHLVAKEILSNA